MIYKKLFDEGDSPNHYQSSTFQNIQFFQPTNYYF